MSDGFGGDGFVYDVATYEYLTMLIIEDGTIVSEADGDAEDANSYVTADDVLAYATLTGSAWSPASDLIAEQAIIRSMLYVENLENRFNGQRASALQVLAWPRNYVYNALRTAYISAVTIPKGVKNAVCEGAIIELASPGTLFASSLSITGATKRTKKKIGPLETEQEYFEGASAVQLKRFEKLMALLAPYLGAGASLELMRA